jgi:hypothetical protein
VVLGASYRYGLEKLPALGLSFTPSSGAVCGLPCGPPVCAKRGFGFGGVGGRTGFTGGSGGGGKVDRRTFFGMLLGIRDFGDAFVEDCLVGVFGVLGGVFIFRSEVSR